MQNGLLCAKPGVRNESTPKRTSMPASSNRSVSSAGWLLWDKERQQTVSFIWCFCPLC